MSALEKLITKIQKNPLGFIREAFTAAVEDAGKLLLILAYAPYGMTVKQIASLMHIKDDYAQALLNVAVKAGTVEEIAGGNSVALYKLKTKGE